MRYSATVIIVMLAAASVARAESCQVRDPDIAGAYVGGCKGGWAEGHGEASGRDSYVGDFADGLPNGYGIYKWANGNVYDGEWKNDKRTGHGSFTWTNGNYYDGQWLDGKRNGRGIYTWKGGNVYDGEWKNDSPVGQR